MVNVCIATRKDDTALRDKIQDAMDAIGWNDKAKMDELMDTVLTQQPAANQLLEIYLIHEKMKDCGMMLYRIIPQQSDKPA